MILAPWLYWGGGWYEGDLYVDGDKRKTKTNFVKQHCQQHEVILGFLFLFSGGLPEGKLLIGLSESRALWAWGMYFPLRSIRLRNLAEEYNFGDDEDEINGAKKG